MKYLEYLLECNCIHINTINLIEQTNQEGLSIAKKLGIRFLGIWKEVENKYVFNDDDGTGTSFLAGNMEEAKEKLKQKYKDFGLVYAH